MNNSHAVTRFAMIAAFGGFVFGLDAANISGGIRFITALFGLDEGQQGFVASCALFGVLAALFVTGPLCDIYGRKKVLLGIALTYSASTIISSIAPSYPVLIFGRFIGGVAFASLTVSAMYIGEIAPADKRGKFVSVNQLLITLGSFVAFVVNWMIIKALPTSDFLTDANVWRYMLAAELIPNIIWVSLLLTIPESPRWLMLKGRDEEAMGVLRKLGTEAEAQQTFKDVREYIDNAHNDPTLMEQLEGLFSKAMIPILAVVVVYAIVQGGTGMNAVLFFAPTVFEQIGMSVEDTFMQTAMLGAIAVVFTLVAIFTVEKLGRRTLTLIGLTLIATAHFSTTYGFKTATYEITEQSVAKLEAQELNVSPIQGLVGKEFATDVELKAELAEVYSANELPLVVGPIIDSSISINPVFVLFGIFAFLAAFNMSIGPIMWVVFSEVFSSNVRAVAVPFAALVQTLSAVTIQQFFPWSLSNWGAGTTFMSYGILAVIGLVVLFFIMPETKGKSIEEVEESLKWKEA